MTTTQQWLGQQIKGLQSVRNVYMPTDNPADLLVRTWVGMSVNIYFLDGVPNLRTLKRILSENTRTYQASMIIALHELLPADKTRFVPQDWMVALHELNSERIYSWIPGEHQLRQVHFDPLPDGVEREAWHGGAVHLEKLRVLNITSRIRAMKGQYMMADFGPNPYWRTSERRGERLRARWQRGPQDYVRTRYDAGGMPGGADEDSLNRAYTSQLERSYQLLEVDLGAPQDEVKRAFRRLARLYHPDVSELEKAEAEMRFREINVAYEYIKTKRRWT